MQPPEPVPGPVQQPGPVPPTGPVVPGQPGPGGPPLMPPGPPGVTPPGPAPAGKRPNRRLRLWLAMGAGILALFCLGGVGVFVSLYDEATKIDRATPDQVTSSFLRAYLVNRNDQDAALYTCKSGANLNTIAALRAEMINREERFGTSVNATWASLTIVGAAKEKKAVSTELTIAGWADGQQVSSRNERWTFDVVDQDGWRVCGAKKGS